MSGRPNVKDNVTGCGIKSGVYGILYILTAELYLLQQDSLQITKRLLMGSFLEKNIFLWDLFVSKTVEIALTFVNVHKNKNCL